MQPKRQYYRGSCKILLRAKLVLLLSKNYFFKLPILRRVCQFRKTALQVKIIKFIFESNCCKSIYSSFFYNHICRRQGFLLALLCIPIACSAVVVNDASELEAQILLSNTSGDEITFGQNITYSGPTAFQPINATTVLTSTMGSYTIDGNNFSLINTSITPLPGLFVRSNENNSTLTIQNLTINGAQAKGGSGAGGGLGAGGGIYIGKAEVILDNVHFVNCSAVGSDSLSGLSGGAGFYGNGGQRGNSQGAGAGGGGFNGNGGGWI